MGQRYPGKASEARHALASYMALTGQESGDLETGLSDLLTDLLHLANEEGMPVLNVLQRATLVFCDEASEKEETAQ